MRPETFKDAIAHGHREYPREACGLVIISHGAELYVPCRNIAEGTDHFVIDPESYAAAEDRGEIVAVVHTHPDASAEPSQADLVSCEASGLKWAVISIPGGDMQVITPRGYQAPLIGRQFSHGVLDCYSLVRDYYLQARGVRLPDFDRSAEWWNRGQNLYLENFQKAGFAPVNDGSLLPGDVILMQIRSSVPNHAAIYLGNDLILHHLQNRLSSRDVYGGYWRKNSFMVIRHEGAR